MRNPWYALFIFLIVLFFPLNLLDYLILIIVNIGVAILNAIMWIITIIANGLIWVINQILMAIEGGLDTAGIDVGDVPTLPIFEYFQQDWIIVDIFGTTTCVLTIILSLMGLSFPIW